MQEKMKELLKALDGVHNYLPTPFHADYRINPEGLRDNVAFYVRRKPKNMAITVAGGYGEGWTLDLEEHKEMVAAAVEGAQGEIPIMAGVIGGYQTSVRMAVNAQAAGAGSIIIFFPPASPKEEDAYRYFRDITTAVSMGVIIFPRGKAEYWPRVMTRLAEIPNVIGFVPPGGSDTVAFGNSQSSRLPNRLIWIAENEPDAGRSYPWGCRAYTTAAAALVPDACHDFWAAGVGGDETAMKEVDRSRIQPIIRIRGYKPGYGISGIKVAMEALGLAGGPVRPPLVQVAREDRAGIVDILRRHPEVRDLVRNDAA